jgi:hypothetical protein
MKTYIFNFYVLTTLLCLVNLSSLKAQSCMHHTSQITNTQKRQSIFNPETESNSCDHQKKIRVYFHLAKKGATSTWKVSDVMDVLNLLNKDFNTHNIFFEWDEVINFTDVKITSSFESDPNFVNHTDGVDIYISADGIEPDGGAVSNGGFQGSKITTAIFVTGTTGFMQQGAYPPYYPTAKTSLISHEMGHLLGLFHIDYKDASGCQEYADGTNSSTCGDYISDTPPVNKGYNYNSGICQYYENTSNLALLNDPLGNKYTSAIVISDNIMRGSAISSLYCFEKFTPGQGEKMCNMINTQNHLKNTLISNPTNVQIKQDIINFKVYPNPVNNNVLFVTSNGDLKAPFQIIICDLLGKVMLKREFMDGTEAVNVSDLPKGVYVLSILTAGQKVFVTKIIIN